MAGEVEVLEQHLVQRDGDESTQGELHIVLVQRCHSDEGETEEDEFNGETGHGNSEVRKLDTRNTRRTSQGGELGIVERRIIVL